MKKDPVVFIRYIIESVEIIESYTSGVSRDEFLSSVQLQDSVIRRIEVIGESVKNLDAEMKDKYPDISWKRIAGMRDTLIHGYLGVDLKLIWKVATEDAPELMKRLREILHTMGDQ